MFYRQWEMAMRFTKSIFWKSTVRDAARQGERKPEKSTFFSFLYSLRYKDTSRIGVAIDGIAIEIQGFMPSRPSKRQHGSIVQERVYTHLL